jgi:hypothetical protein
MQNQLHMTRNLLLFFVLSLAFFSCTKHLDDRLAGTWKLDQAYKKELFGRDYFQTGYEDGLFTFFENGNAAYTDPQDTLSGYWRSDHWTRYNAADDETEILKYLEIFLADFSRNKTINWRFDDFDFRNGWKCIRARQFSLGRDRVYEFIRP